MLVSGADGGSGLDKVEWRVDSGPATPGVSGLTTATVSGNGVHTLETRVLDVAGNASTWRSEAVQIDTVAPTNTTTAPSGPVPNPYAATITGTDADSTVDHVEWKVDGGAVQSGPAGTSVSIRGNGTHTLATQIVDKAGNASGWRTDTIVIDITLNHDTTPPNDTTATAPAGWSPDPLAILVTGNDPETDIDRVQWRLAGQSITTVVGTSTSVPFDNEGIFHLETRVRNLAGLWSSWRSQTIRIDFTVPEDTTAFPTGWTNSRTFAPAGIDALSGPATFEYSINGATPTTTAPYSSPVDVGGDGVFTIEHRILDAAGQSSEWHTGTLKVDSVAPTNTSGVPSSAWSSTALSLPLTGTDATSTLDKMQWRLNSDGEIHDGGPAVVDVDGEYDLETRAVDKAGNVSTWRTIPSRSTRPRRITPPTPPRRAGSPLPTP